MKNKEIIGGRYEIITPLNYKRKHEVFLARHINLNTLWILKKSKGDGQGYLIDEMNILKRLNHEGIPRVIDFFKCNEDVFLVEDYFEGVTLKEMIERYHNKINEKKLLYCLKNIAKIIRYLHNFKPYPIIYGDLKPSNIMITHEKTVKLIDFDAARFKDDDSDKSLGTIGYAAPEQFYGNMNEATDIYSFGMLMYHVLIDWYGLSNTIIKKEDIISNKIWYIIEKCVHTNPKRRYQNMEAIIKELNA